MSSLKTLPQQGEQAGLWSLCHRVSLSRLGSGVCRVAYELEQALFCCCMLLS